MYIMYSKVALSINIHTTCLPTIPRGKFIGVGWYNMVRIVENIIKCTPCLLSLLVLGRGFGRVEEHSPVRRDLEDACQFAKQ